MISKNMAAKTGRNLENNVKSRRPNKLMGQHFMVDKTVLKKIIEAANPQSNETVLEIGPGRGALTREIARRAGRVIAVEKDEFLAETLEKSLTTDFPNATILKGDILKLPEAFFASISPYRVIAAIPYYLTARLIRKLLTEVPPPTSIFLTVQREVADRIIAQPPQMNLLALAVQAYGTPYVHFSISKASFSPKPKVESALLEIQNISDKKFKDPQKINEKTFFRLAKAAFRGKRKTLENSLAAGLDLPKTEVRRIIEKAGISPKARPEAVSLAQWLRLSTPSD